MRGSRLNSSRYRLSRADTARLQGVAFSLAQKYPPDWLERRGAQVYGVTLLGCFLLACLIAVFWSPWWAYLMPVLLPPLISGVIPLCLLGREPGRPRWAHPKAIMDEDDVSMIAAIVDKIDSPFRERFSRHCPADNGAKFYTLWQALHHAANEEPR